jgi:hypothetical protein
VQLTEVPAGATGPSVGESDARAYDGVPPSGSPRWTLTCSRGADASAVRLHVPPGLDAAQWTCHTRADHVEVRLRAHVHAAWMRDHDDGGEWSALEGALPLCSPQVRALSTQPYPHSPTQFPSFIFIWRSNPRCTPPSQIRGGGLLGVTLKGEPYD